MDSDANMSRRAWRPPAAGESPTESEARPAVDTHGKSSEWGSGLLIRAVSAV
jgi:hypothetical protein